VHNTLSPVSVRIDICSVYHMNVVKVRPRFTPDDNRYVMKLLLRIVHLHEFRYLKICHPSLVVAKKPSIILIHVRIFNLCFHNYLFRYIFYNYHFHHI
jgi:hypothetical protein